MIQRILMVAVDAAVGQPMAPFRIEDEARARGAATAALVIEALTGETAIQEERS